MKAISFTFSAFALVFSWCQCNILEFDVLERNRKEIKLVPKSKEEKREENFFDLP